VAFETPKLPTVTAPDGGNEPLSQREQELLTRLFRSPERMPQEFWSYLKSRQEADPPQLPISSIFGWSGTTPLLATVNAATDVTGDETYHDQTGPSLTGLPPGKYMALWWCYAKTTALGPEAAYMSLSVNGSDLGDSVAMAKPVTADATLVSGLVGSLPLDSNTVKARYRIVDATQTVRFSNRNLLLIKYGDL
jgi:hypothetical protein